MLRPIVLAVLLCAAGLAQARECHKVEFPEHVQVQGTDLSLNGVGLRTVTIFNVQVYVAALYVTHPGTEAAPILNSPGPTRLVLQFVRDLTAQQARDAWAKDLSRDRSPGDLLPLKTRLAQLQAWMTDLHTGQRLSFTRLPGEGLSVALDDQVKGTLLGDDFARAFLEIWLGDDPSGRKIKKSLLGGTCT
jgi:hypothetical protein